MKERSTYRMLHSLLLIISLLLEQSSSLNYLKLKQRVIDVKDDRESVTKFLWVENIRLCSHFCHQFDHLWIVQYTEEVGKCLCLQTEILIHENPALDSKPNLVTSKR